MVKSDSLAKRDKETPKKKDSKIWFTIKKKLECLTEVILGLGIINISILIYQEAGKYKEQIIRFLGYFGIILIIIVGFYLYVRLNSLKYRNIKTKRHKK